MKCQRCIKPAMIHITEVLGEGNYEELHLCEECGQKYLYEIQQPQKPPLKIPTTEPDSDDRRLIQNRQCEVCGMKFIEFRNSGRLGCAHDYIAFETELLPLLDSIHGATKHCGKIPRKQPQKQWRQQELTRLRKELQQSVVEEAYERSAKLRDQIRSLENSSDSEEYPHLSQSGKDAGKS